PAVAHVLDTWITAVCAGVSRDVPARIDVLVEPGSPQPLPINARFRARRQVIWLPPSAGEFLFIGMEETSNAADLHFPLAPAAWLQTLAPATLSTATTAGVIGDDATWRGFASFQTLVARCE